MSGHLENSNLCSPFVKAAVEIFAKRWRCVRDAAERQSRQELRHGVAIPSRPLQLQMLRLLTLTPSFSDAASTIEVV